MGVVPEIVDQVGRADLLPVDGECLRSHQLHETLHRCLTNHWTAMATIMQPSRESPTLGSCTTPIIQYTYLQLEYEILHRS